MPRGRSLAITALMVALIAGCAVAFARTQALKQDRPPARAVEIPATLELGKPERIVVLVRADTTLDATVIDEDGGFVERLADKQQVEAGRVRLAWDGTRANDSGASPGSYRLRISLGSPMRSITFPEVIQVSAPASAKPSARGRTGDR